MANSISRWLIEYNYPFSLGVRITNVSDPNG